jgi:hypothetical protein
MFVVNQSATGQYVITHPPTNTVMVGDDLVATFERMRSFAESLDESTQVSAPTVSPAPAPSRLPILGIAALVLLPFVWLGALHVSLGRLVSELRAPSSDADDRKELRARIERLESSLAPPDVRPVKPKGPKKTPAPAAVEVPPATLDAKAVGAAKAEPDEADDAD